MKFDEGLILYLEEVDNAPQRCTVTVAGAAGRARVPAPPHQPLYSNDLTINLIPIARIVAIMLRTRVIR
jgi:hypothetical protein